MLNRTGGRAADEIRPIHLEMGVNAHAEGSCLIKLGKTHVLCTASLEERVPLWLRGSGEGWISAEYGMLPRATHERTRREAARGKRGGRTMEIQRLVARVLRAAVDLRKLGQRQLLIDCDVLQADGGTRTASITGGFMAMAQALGRMHECGALPTLPISHQVAAISVGLVRKDVLLDLDYSEDSGAAVDCNVAMTGDGRLVEVQGTGEDGPFARDGLDQILILSARGC